MLATLGLRNGTSPFASTMQVKGLWVCTILPKWEVSTGPAEVSTRTGSSGRQASRERTGDGVGMAL